MSNRRGPRITNDADVVRLVDDYYESAYANVHGCGSLGVANRAMHRRLERHRDGQFFARTVELGAGNGEHFPHIRHSFSEYIATDIRRPSTARYMDKAQAGRGRIRFEQTDCLSLPFGDESVDRIVAGCLIMHLENPAAALLEWQRVLSPDGCIDFLVPCDPGLVTRAFRHFVSERAAQRLAAPKDYSLVNALEHVSSFPRIRRIAEATVSHGRALTIRYRPLGIHSWNLNAFTVFSIDPAATGRGARK